MIRNYAKTLTAAAAACLLLSACDDGKSATGPGTDLPALGKWSFSGREYAYKSGIAVRRRDSNDKVTSGLTVWLTDQSIDCSLAGAVFPDMRGGWIGIDYPETSLGKGLVKVFVGGWPGGPGVNGSIDLQGSATLSQADTSGAKTVAGSLDFHADTADPEEGFGKADVTGSFSVPYCPGI